MEQPLLNSTKTLIESLRSLILTSPWKNQYIDIIEQNIQSLEEPCRLAVTGRVKSGKSSLINVLLGEDLAKVGITETTATINIFKYGTPPYTEKPILCKYHDGTSEWITKKELDDLQGNTESILFKIKDIESLTYFIKNDCLKKTILIDTPGIDALVGEEGDAHQEQTEIFLGLRKQHEEETISISNNADAVILLLGDVVHDSDKDFIDGFLKNRGRTSCINTIGILSQIDLTDERVIKRASNAKSRYEVLSDYLSCVVPISSGIKRYLPTIEEAQRIKMMLSLIPNKDYLNNVLLRSEKMYLLPKLPGLTISLEERKAIYKQGKVPFRCFAVILKTLYDNTIEDALKELDDISGIDNLKSILNNYFFNRSHQIKCEIAIRQALLIIWEIINCGYIEKDYSFTNNNSLANLADNLSKIQHKFEELLSFVDDFIIEFQTFVNLVENKELFSAVEFEELKLLFSNQVTEFSEKRLEYWYTISNNAWNEQKREIAKRAYFKYSDIVFI